MADPQSNPSAPELDQCVVKLFQQVLDRLAAVLADHITHAFLAKKFTARRLQVADTVREADQRIPRIDF